MLRVYERDGLSEALEGRSKNPLSESDFLNTIVETKQKKLPGSSICWPGSFFCFKPVLQAACFVVIIGTGQNCGKEQY